MADWRTKVQAKIFVSQPYRTYTFVGIQKVDTRAERDTTGLLIVKRERGSEHERLRLDR